MGVLSRIDAELQAENERVKTVSVLRRDRNAAR